MKITFTTENVRKDKLFAAWIGHLTDVHTQKVTQKIDELVEGVAHISEITNRRLTLTMEESGQSFTIPIVPEIKQHSMLTDKVFFVIGRQGQVWWPVDVISIGSIIGTDKKEMHITVNPLLADLARSPLGAVH